MKRILTTAVLLVVFVTVTFAQDAFYIYRNDGQFNAFFTDEVDSIIYSRIDSNGKEHDEYMTQILYTKDSTYQIPLLAIDSISFDVNDLVISPDFVSLDEHPYSVKGADEVSGFFTLLFRNQPLPALTYGKIVAIDSGNMIYLRRIISINTKQNEVNLYTEPAYLADVFLAGTFVLTNNPRNNSRRAYHPIEVWGDDDTFRVANKRSKATADIFDKTIDYSGKMLKETDWWKLYLEKCTFKVHLNFEMACNFNSPKEAYDKFCKGELAVTRAGLEGEVKTELGIRYDATAPSYRVESSPTCLKENVISPIDAIFPVNGIPVQVRLITHLMGDVEFQSYANFTASTSFKVESKAALGLVWSQRDGFSPYASYSQNFEYYPPTIFGNAHFEGKISLFPRINFAVYGITGPTFDLRPYGKIVSDLGFHDNLLENKKDDYYGAELVFKAGYDGAVGINFLPYYGTNLPYISPTWNVYEKDLHRTPNHIKFKESSATQLEEGKPVTVTFHVTDYDILFGETYTRLPLTVKFTTNCGKVKNDFGIVDVATGDVKMEWTPEGTTTNGLPPQINAFLYRSDGTLLAGDKWVTELKTSLPVTISNVTTTSALYRPTDHPQHFEYKSNPYEFKYNVATTVNLMDDTNVENWGYCYEGPDSEQKSRISLKGAPYQYEDTRFPYYRNGSPTSHTAKLYPFVKYKDDEEYYYGAPVDYPLVYPESSSIKLTACSTPDVVTREKVEVNGVTYDYCSTFILDYDATGAYWIGVVADEFGDGWTNWDNNLLTRQPAKAMDGSNRLTLNYYYNKKVLEGEYKIGLKGIDYTHGTDCHSGSYVKLKHDGYTFTGCELVTIKK